jgi:hypothetical protein
LYVSWSGGTILQFWGTGFNSNPASNTVELKTYGLRSDGKEVRFLGTLMNDQDEFRSEPDHAGRISYTMPSFNDIRNQYNLPLDWFNQYD